MPMCAFQTAEQCIFKRRQTVHFQMPPDCAFNMPSCEPSSCKRLHLATRTGGGGRARCAFSVRSSPKRSEAPSPSTSYSVMMPLKFRIFLTRLRDGTLSFWAPVRSFGRDRGFRLAPLPRGKSGQPAKAGSGPSFLVF